MNKDFKPYNPAKLNRLVGPYHDFVLIPQKLSYQEGYERYKEFPRVRVSDDLITYLWDSMQWIPTLDFTSRSDNCSEVMGISRWGLSIIEKRGAQKAQTILMSWRDLFKCAGNPVVISIPGAEGPFVKYAIPQNELIEQLEELTYFCHKVIEGKYWILQLGV